MIQVETAEDLFSKEWRRAISVTRDGCNSVKTNSTDAVDGTKTSPSLTSPSTPGGYIAGKGVHADKHNNSGDSSDSLGKEKEMSDRNGQAEPEKATTSDVNCESNAPLVNNREELDGKEAVS